jgi:type IV pilus assembly protein PilX
MSTTMQRGRPTPKSRQAGYVLVTGLLFLIVLTLLGVSLFRATGLMARISANTRDKERAFEAAQSALQYGEWSIQASGGGGGQNCATTALVAASGVPSSGNTFICSNPQSNWATPHWTSGFSYTPPNLAVSKAGGFAGGSSADVNYQEAPSFYIERIGQQKTGSVISQVYQVTAIGYGGNADTTTVLRSTYKLTPPNPNFGAQ